GSGPSGGTSTAALPRGETQTSRRWSYGGPRLTGEPGWQNGSDTSSASTGRAGTSSGGGGAPSEQTRHEAERRAAWGAGPSPGRGAVEAARARSEADARLEDGAVPGAEVALDPRLDRTAAWQRPDADAGRAAALAQDPLEAALLDGGRPAVGVGGRGGRDHPGD